MLTIGCNRKPRVNKGNNMNLKNKFYQLKKKYPKTMILFKVVLLLVILGLLYEICKGFGGNLYNLFH